MIYCSALRLWSQICLTRRSCWFPDLVSLTFCTGVGCLGPDGWRHTCEMDTEHFANLNLSVVVAKCYFGGLWCETELLCNQTFPQPWPGWSDFWLFTNINGRAGWGCACLFPVCGWIEWPSSGMVGFYNNESLTSQLCLVPISWSSARMHVVEHLTSWWLIKVVSYYQAPYWIIYYHSSLGQSWPSTVCCCSTQR